MPKYKVLGNVEHENKAYCLGNVVEMSEQYAALHERNLELFREKTDKESSLNVTTPTPDAFRESESSLNKKK